MKLKKGDRVKVIAGSDRGVVGEIIAVFPETNRVRVQGVNIVKRHVRDTPNPSTGRSTPGGIISQESTVHVSNVQLVTKDDAGNEVVTRLGRKRVEVNKKRSDGEEYPSTRGVRISRKTGKEI